MSALQDLAMWLADAASGVIPSPVPAAERLRSCRLVSHRGEHDNLRVKENTLEAFGIASDAGVWGIECDIRWTLDDQPVICHDGTTSRVFGEPLEVGAVSLATLRAAVPHVPTLEELLAEFGGNTHLMLEIKDLGQPLSTARRQRLQQLLAQLEPGRDFHMLALEPRLFEGVDFLPREHCLPVAELNVGRLSSAALEQGFGGLTGHYLLLGRGRQARHEAAGQRVGTGFVRTRYGLYRELNRGVEWIFSNHAVSLQRMLEDALNQ